MTRPEPTAAEMLERMLRGVSVEYQRARAQLEAMVTGQSVVLVWREGARTVTEAVGEAFDKAEAEMGGADDVPRSCAGQARLIAEAEGLSQNSASPDAGRVWDGERHGPPEVIHAESPPPPRRNGARRCGRRGRLRPMRSRWL